ncbi:MULTISPECIES: SDR family oxidoreductase [unclassified Sulfitobacter]|uniref:SDR family oxidoreductase n=1 Tax=unclassified Sulfitobacter TaxID=196795 RepID=UPI0007C2201C|nr:MULTISPECIES: SDR family oxidoreductase [unclassified Sulfitobacter]KZY00885.1 NAD(P)-dependent oxidoreductase [Sulfitobacter sp. HI0023]KZY23197.1 NAD(P)-dependent oxidoreductase [Sulfitobacter sp. HI0040]
MITVFGATGTTGAPLVDTLLAKGATVRAVTSDLSKLDALKAKGCEAVVADFTDPAALARACDGAEKIYLVTPAHLNMRQWKANVIEAAKSAGVRHIVLATGLGASPKAGLTFGKWHSETQELLKQSGLDWTFVQPTYFMQNLLWQAGNIAKDAVYYDDLGGPVAWIDARDIADVAAEALTAPGYESKALGLTGPEALTGEDIAALLSEVTGRTVTCAPLSVENAKAGMVAGGMQDEVAGAMVELASIAPKGYLAGIETTVSDVMGRPARRFADFVAENRDAFVK